MSSGLEALKILADAFQNEARFSYYFAAGLMMEGLFGNQYDRPASVLYLTKARECALTSRRESVISEALRQAELVRVQPRSRPAAVAEY